MKTAKQRNADVATQVTAYACGKCDRVYRDAGEASRCCRCASCETKFQRAHTYASTCDGCRYGSMLREARARVRRVEKDLASAKQTLKRLIEQGNPGKGS